MILLATAATLAAQNSTPIDNDQVKVIVVKQEPHKKTSLHEHKVNRVMIYLNAGKQDFEYPDKPKSTLVFKAGEAKWSPAGGMHIGEITTPDPVGIVEVELKKPGSSAKMAPNALDVVKVDSKHYKVDFENEQVRVIRGKVGPHETVPMHEHMTNRLVVYLTEQNFGVTMGDGKLDTMQHPASEVVWSGPSKRKEEDAKRQAVRSGFRRSEELAPEARPLAYARGSASWSAFALTARRSSLPVPRTGSASTRQMFSRLGSHSLGRSVSARRCHRSPGSISGLV